MSTEYSLLDAKVSAGAELVAVSAEHTPGQVPHGECQIAWTDPNGYSQLLDVVSSRRMDIGPMWKGQEFAVTVQGRANRDLRLPLHTATLAFVLTLDPIDVAEVVVGDVTRHNGWLLGVRLIGARPAQRLLPLTRPED